MKATILLAEDERDMREVLCDYSRRRAAVS